MCLQPGEDIGEETHADTDQVFVVVKGEGLKRTIRIFLRYDARGTSSITHLQRVSTPGRRVYVGSSEIPKVLGGYGINIVSTSRGLMSGKAARRENIGGELLAQIY